MLSASEDAVARGDAQRAQFASLSFVSCRAFSAEALEALNSCAEALGYTGSPRFVDVSAYSSQELVLAVHAWDPWSVVAIDDASARMLAAAFGDEAADFAPDAPVTVRGYRLVAVPGFEECLKDKGAKRVAWGRMKAAAHPQSPY